MPPERRTCLLVLGMHRSGTSALARVLSLAGAKLPATLLGPSSSNPKGHWESLTLVNYHDAIFSELGSRWDDWRFLADMTAARQQDIKRDIGSILTAEYGGAPLIVVKDPRICRFAPLFLEALADAQIAVRVVLPFRDPLEVIDSLWRRDRLAPTDTALLWLRHVLDAEIATRGKVRAFVSFATLLMDWETCFQRLSTQLGLAWPHASEDVAPQVAAFLTPSEHPTHGSNPALLVPVLKDWIGEIHAALLALELDPGNRAALAALDRVRYTLNLATPILDQLRTEEKSRHENQARNYQAEAETFRARVAQLELQLAGMRASSSWRITAPLRWIKQKLPSRPTRKST